MNHKIQASTIAARAIHQFIAKIHKLFLFCKERADSIKKRKEKLSKLDQANPDFVELLDDKQENTRMFWCLSIAILSVLVDFVVVYEPMHIICQQSNWPTALAYITPAALIIIEIGISHSQIIAHRNGSAASWLVRNVQYFVVVILVALSVLMIFFTARIYDQSIDGISFLSYMIGAVLFQVALLVASILLHLWLIRNSEIIADTMAYFRFKLSHQSLSQKIERMESQDNKKHLPAFMTNSQKLVLQIEQFKKEHPNANEDFAKVIPVDLVNAINKVMGRTIISADAEIAA